MENMYVELCDFQFTTLSIKSNTYFCAQQGIFGFTP